ncbi:hypothetical protein JCM14076_06450 [Methylosoma difficile]
MYNNHIFVKSFTPTAALEPYTAVKMGSADGTVAQAVDANDFVVGFVNDRGVSADDVAKGKKVDVVMAGIAEVKAGGTITLGARLSVTTAGKVVTTTPPTAGTTVEVVAIALASAVSNDVIPALIAFSTSSQPGA